MTQLEAIELAKQKKYKVLEVEIEDKHFFIVEADPIDLPNSSFNGKTTIATNIGEQTKECKESRLQDMKDDIKNFYGKNSETYKKIVWPLL